MEGAKTIAGEYKTDSERSFVMVRILYSRTAGLQTDQARRHVAPACWQGKLPYVLAVADIADCPALRGYVRMGQEIGADI